MKPGVSLIELLLVAGIISILVATAVPNYFDAKVRAQVTQVRLDLNRVEGALQYYHIDMNRYPPPPALGDPVPLRHLENGPWLSGGPAYDRFKQDLPQPTLFQDPPYLDYGFVDAREAEPLAGPWMGKKSTTAVKEQPHLDGPQVWIVASVGPARILTPLGSNRPTDYDPTNGVISPGKIYRVGPTQ
jgi:type II secretory pathway pseudopilin PulG